MSEEHHGFKPETKAIASGRRKNELSLAPVLYPTSVFEIDSAEEAHEMAKAVGAERFYTRYGNPTINAFESGWLFSQKGIVKLLSKIKQGECKQEI